MTRSPSGRRRIPYVRRCEVQENGGSALSGLICNLSALGAYVALEPIPPSGATVMLSFRLPRNVRPVRVESQVTWENPHQDNPIHGLPPGCGLRFLSLSPEDRRRIDGLIDDYIPLIR
jgi:uncharacterized protein (TIGR02266 family)